jgi:hypothetical protein
MECITKLDSDTLSKKKREKRAKKVRFSDGIESPEIARRCKCCGHRNIKPLNVEMVQCIDCNRSVCVNCYIPDGRCVECYSDEMVCVCKTQECQCNDCKQRFRLIDISDEEDSQELL